MSPLTLLFALVIIVCVVFCLLMNSVLAKLGRFERFHKEYLQAIQDEDAEAKKTAQKATSNAVEVYNNSISRFPGIVVASLFGFKVVSYGRDEIDVISKNESENKEERLQMDYVTLNNGIKMPMLGFGVSVWKKAGAR